jgi:hypothetical protein
LGLGETPLALLKVARSMEIRYFACESDKRMMKYIISKVSALPSSGEIESRTMAPISRSEFAVYEPLGDPDESCWIPLEKCKLVLKAEFFYETQVLHGNEANDKHSLNESNILELVAVNGQSGFLHHANAQSFMQKGKARLYMLFCARYSRIQRNPMLHS